MKEIAVNYEVNPKDYKAIWRAKTTFNKFYGCLNKTEKKNHSKDLKYIRQCFLNAYTEAYRKERKIREKTEGKLEELNVILEMFKAIEEAKKNEV